MSLRKFIGFQTSSDANSLSFLSSFAISEETSRNVIVSSADRDAQRAVGIRVRFAPGKSVLRIVGITRVVFSSPNAVGEMPTWRTRQTDQN
jgi:hypothetical protein